jgi:metallophosphoesterase superfamily enzyme
MTIVRGNHDREAGDVHAAIDIESHDPPLVRPPFAFTHVPEPSEMGYAIGGHLHPGADLVGAARQHVRLPCFWVRPRVAVLPAFGEFTGLWPVTPTPGDRVFVVAGNEVLER